MPLLNLFHSQGRGRPIGGGGLTAYERKALDYSPIAYWPLNEKGGGVAHDISGNGLHGAYVTTTLGRPGIGDGNTSALFDGTTSEVNIYSAGFNAAFNGQQGSAAIWCKVFNAAVWADAAARNALLIEVDGDNNLHLTKYSDADRIFARYEANSTPEANTWIASPIDWFHLVMTWDYAGDAVNYYLNAAVATPDTGLGQWAGVIDAAECSISDKQWYGWLAHCLIFDAVLTQSQVTALATV